jgi:ribonuclease VapC
MIVDTSAIMAVLLREPDAKRFELLLAAAPRRLLSTASFVEVINVIDRRLGADLVATAEALLAAAKIELAPFTVEQAQWARHARLTYGIGRHRAGLNFGDCFVYALAKSTGEPLLFKGDDFVHTDIVPAI